jgi:uncharacterized protein YydD (DUF2326 family)
MRSLGKPLAFETMEENMRTNFNRVRLKCEALLAQKVDELKQEVKGLRGELRDMREEMEGRTTRIKATAKLKVSRNAGAR